jgi:hypothetical protein
MITHAPQLICGHFSAVVRIRSSINARTGDTCVAPDTRLARVAPDACLAPFAAPKGAPPQAALNSRCAQIVTKYTPPPA